jgi:hypothetical protein
LLSDEQAGFDPHHPHEPEVLPTFDDEGRCLVCHALEVAKEEGWEQGVAQVRAQPLWLLTGDLEWLEYATADYIAKWGTQWTGRPYDGNTAGLACAVANMAMTVIRKNIRRVGTAPDQEVQP